MAVDIFYFGFLALYTGYALMVLGLGITAAIAHVSPSLHANLHVIGFDAQTLPQQIAQALVYVPITVVLALVLNALQTTPQRLALVGLFGLAVPTVGVLAQGYRWRWPKHPDERQLARLLFLALLPAVGLALLINPQQLH